MNLLNENYFIENKNGRVVELQLLEVKKKANIWFDLLVFSVAFAFVGYFGLYEGKAPTWVIFAIAAIYMCFWFVVRLPAIFKYYVLILPDVRAKEISYTTGKLVYDKKYILQAGEIRISLPGDANEGLLLGNTYEVYYLPRAKMALSARLMQFASESYQAREFTNLFGQLLGFTESDLRANRSGEFTPEQKRVILKRGWWVFLVLFMFFAYVAWLWLPMLIAPAFVSDSIVFSICMAGVVVFVLLGVFAGFRDARNILALFEGRVEQSEGILHLSERVVRSGKSQTTLYYLNLDHKFELQISKRIYGALIQGLYYRVYYTPRFKYLASAEVLKIQAS